MISKTFSKALTDHSPLSWRNVYIQPHLKPAFRALEMQVEPCPNVLHYHYTASQDAVCVTAKRDAVRMHSKWHLICGFNLTLLQNIYSQFEHSPHAQ